MYAFSPEQLRALADYIESQNEGTIGEQNLELATHSIDIYDLDSQVLGKVAYDDNGVFGLIVKKTRGY